jgi:predicted HTH transcriptional regulator
VIATAQGDFRSYTEDDVQRFLRQGEGATVELKTNIPEPRVIARHIAGFANSTGGVILLGVDERGEIVGCDVASANRLYQAALKRLNPVPETKFHDVKIASNKAVALIEVAKSDGPVLFDGGAYARQGAQTRIMTATDMLALYDRTKPPVHTFENLAQAITQQTQIIEKLREELSAAGRFTNRMKEWLISGVTGAVLGWIVTKIFGG